MLLNYCVILTLFTIINIIAAQHVTAEAHHKANVSGAHRADTLYSSPLPISTHQHYWTVAEQTSVPYCSCGPHSLRLPSGECKPGATFVPVKLQDSNMFVRVNTVDLNYSDTPIMGEPYCGPDKALLTFPEKSFVILSGGILYLPALGYFYKQGLYCLEHFTDTDYLELQNKIESHIQLNAKICIKYPVYKCKKQYLHNTNVSKSHKETEIFLSKALPVMCFGEFEIEWSPITAPSLQLDCPIGTRVKTIALSDLQVGFYQNRAGAKLRYKTQDDLFVDFNYDEFCLNYDQTDKLELMYCSFDDKQATLRKIPQYFRKCCSQSLVYSRSRKSCIPHGLSETNEGELFTTILSELTAQHEDNRDAPAKQTNEEEYINQYRTMKIKYGMPLCQWQEQNLSSFSWMTDGRLVIANSTLELDMFCVENFYENGQGAEHELAEQKLVICQPHGICYWTSMLRISLMCISCVFLAITLLVCLIQSDLTSNVGRQCLASETFALLLSFTLYVITFFYNELRGTSICVFLGTLNHTAVLSVFFWMNALCYHHYQQFIITRQEARRGRSLYLCYSVWAWGLPIVIASTTAVMDLLPPRYEVIRPHTAVSCFPGNEHTSHWVYVYVPIALLLSINLLVFLDISRRVLSSYCQKRSVRRRDPCRQRLADKEWRQKSKVYARFFVVVGLSWIAEVFSFEANRWFNSCTAWVLTDAFNASTGVFIFLILAYPSMERSWCSGRETHVFSKLTQNTGVCCVGLKQFCCRPLSVVKSEAVGRTSTDYHGNSDGVLSITTGAELSYDEQQLNSDQRC